MMVSTGEWHTIDELLRLPKEYELVNGELRVMTPVGGAHGSVTCRLLAALAVHADAEGLGAVVTEVGFILTRNPDTVRGPDVAFIRKERLVGGIPANFIEGAPDLAVEVLSPDNSAAEIREKIGQYFAAGTQLAWVVDPSHRTVVMHTPGQPQRVVGESGILDGGDVVHGFTLPVAQLFVWLRPAG